MSRTYDIGAVDKAARELFKRTWVDYGIESRGFGKPPRFDDLTVDDQEAFRDDVRAVLAAYDREDGS